jgi:hypothetical protein
MRHGHDQNQAQGGDRLEDEGGTAKGREGPGGEDDAR